jgi:hypothetical protein
MSEPTIASAFANILDRLNKVYFADDPDPPCLHGFWKYLYSLFGVLIAMFGRFLLQTPPSELRAVFDISSTEFFGASEWSVKYWGNNNNAVEALKEKFPNIDHGTLIELVSYLDNISGLAWNIYTIPGIVFVVLFPIIIALSFKYGAPLRFTLYGFGVTSAMILVMSI